MAAIRLGSNVSLFVFGCTSCLIVIHGYFLWKPASASLNGFFSSPLNRCQRTIVTGVLSVVPPLAEELEDDEPPHPAATTNAPAAPQSTNVRARAANRRRTSLACSLIR